jgi:hypothetical protein
MICGLHLLALLRKHQKAAVGLLQSLAWQLNANCSVRTAWWARGIGCGVCTGGIWWHRRCAACTLWSRTIVCATRFEMRLNHTAYLLCVLCGSQNKQRLFSYTALTDWLYTRDLTLYSPMVTICTASFTFSNSTFCPHTVFMCFVWISEQTAIISLYNINWLAV